MSGFYIMDTINDLKSPKLIEAVRLWTGWGESRIPSRDDARLVDRVGEEAASQLLPLVKTLEADFYSSNARLVASNLQEMHEMASADFRQKHPMVADEIVEAFAWCYTFDFK